MLLVALRALVLPLALFQQFGSGLLLHVPQQVLAEALDQLFVLRRVCGFNNDFLLEGLKPADSVDSLPAVLEEGGEIGLEGVAETEYVWMVLEDA